MKKGTKRISASRMQQISEALKVPVSFFYEDAPVEGTPVSRMAEASATAYIADFLSTQESIKLNSAFARISSPAVRRKITELVRTLADETEGAKN